MEENKKKINIQIIVLICAVIVLGAALLFVFSDKLFTNNSNISLSGDETVEVIKESTEVSTDISDDESKVTYENYTGEINVSSIDTTLDFLEYDSTNNILNITKAGTYYLTGENDNLSINVKVTKDDIVYLVIENLKIISNNTSGIIVEKAKEVIINVNGTSNEITGAKNYTYLIDEEENEPDGAIFSKADLVINGEGTLKVVANSGDAIVSKDTLKIINTSISIEAQDDGIRGKDNVIISNANVTVKSDGDAIKSTNTDGTLGNVIITDSKLDLTSSNGDGIDAENILNITNSDITVKTNGKIETKTENDFMNRNMNTVSSTSSDTSSSKGIKAGSEITINSGNININSSDDAIHSNSIVIINDGTLNLSSSDDGIHADTNIIINGGTIDILKSYEGIESAYVEINNGTINVTASDDGINICGGNDFSSMNNRNGMNSFSNVSDDSRKLQINGGKITVTSEGDGLDSNGSIYITGGDIIVNGPTSNGNGPLDYDNKCVVTGGSLIVYGSNGMWQTPSSDSTINTVSFNNSGKSGDKIELKDSLENVVYSVNTVKSYSAILFTGNNIKTGETYTLYVNNSQVSTLTVTSTVNGASSSGNGMIGPNGGDMGGRNNNSMMPNNMAR